MFALILHDAWEIKIKNCCNKTYKMRTAFSPGSQTPQFVIPQKQFTELFLGNDERPLLAEQGLAV
jgi:hypothetical protein